MGGDNAPGEIVAGAVLAAPLLKCEVVLVGDLAQIEPLLLRPKPSNIILQHASETVDMHEKPVEALRKKKDSSIVVAVEMVGRGEADVFVSAGNTGACTAASLLKWRQMHGFHRPAIASVFPSLSGQFVLLDAGASPDSEPEQMVEYALMGRAYAERVMGKRSPVVHLLNVGEEEGKGNAFAKQAYTLLKEFPWFAGNIEGKDMFFDPKVDVVVCDAFVGNIVLKTAEGVGEVIMQMIRNEVPSGPTKLLYAPLKNVMAPLKAKLDYAEYGGSPLLGLNHLTMICHGRSSAKAIKSALLAAEQAVLSGLMDAMRTSIGEALGEK